MARAIIWGFIELWLPVACCKGVHSLKPDLGHLWSIADLLQLRPGFLQGCSFNEMRVVESNEL